MRDIYTLNENVVKRFVTAENGVKDFAVSHLDTVVIRVGVKIN